MILSIEFTSEYIYLAETNTSQTSIKIGTFRKIPMPDGACANGVVVNTASVAAAITTAMKEYHIRAKKALVIIGGTDIIHKELAVPHGSAKQTREMVEHELERLGLARPEYMSDYRIKELKKNQQGGMQNIHACLVPKALIQNYMATIRRAGLIPHQMELANAGMERLAKVLYLDQNEEMTILCCAEKDQVSFLFAGNNTKPIYRLVQIRQDDAIEENAFIVSAVQALTGSNDISEKILDSIEENVSKLVQFHLQTGDATSVGQILMYGSMAEEEDFLRRIESVSGIETRACPLPDCVEHTAGKEDFDFLNIIGANAGMLQSVGEQKRIDFFKSTKEKKKKPITRKDLIPLTIGLVLVCCAALVYPVVMASNTKITEQTKVDNEYVQQPKQKQEYEKRQGLVQYTEAMRIYNDTCEEYIQSIQSARRLTAEDIRKIQELAGEAVQITGYSFNAGVITVNCETTSSVGAASFAKQLTDAAHFATVRYEGFQEGKDKSGLTIYSFTIDCVLWEEADV